MRPGGLLLLTLNLLLGCALRCSPSSTPREPGPGGPLGVVRFPGYWLKLVDGEEVGVNDNIQYVVRRAPAGSRELLFAVKQGFDGSLLGREVYDFPVTNPDYDYYSDTLFAVSLDSSYRVRKATAAEWDAAAKPLHSYHLIGSFKNPQVTPEGVTYNGRLYPKSGATWGTQAALVSPHTTWIAVFSYASKEKPAKTMIPGFGNTEPGHGEVFLDLYNTSTGERVSAARAPYGGSGGGVEPSLLFGGSVWVDERFIVMPLDPSFESCFLGILPEK
jgi:hypothetical protein